MATDQQKVLILGIGNVLLSDEGVGVHAIHEMEKMDWPDNIFLLDGGTGGFHILSLVQEYPIIILIDATLDQDPPGTVKVLEPKYSKDFPKALSSHDIGLKDLIDSAILLKSLPKIYLVTITIQPEQQVDTELSPEIHETLPEITKTVASIIKQMQ
jgi:hydrogenase maturation protease